MEAQLNADLGRISRRVNDRIAFEVSIFHVNDGNRALDFTVASTDKIHDTCRDALGIPAKVEVQVAHGGVQLPNETFGSHGVGQSARLSVTSVEYKGFELTPEKISLASQHLHKKTQIGAGWNDCHPRIVAGSIKAHPVSIQELAAGHVWWLKLRGNKWFGKNDEMYHSLPQAWKRPDFIHTLYAVSMEIEYEVEYQGYVCGGDKETAVGIFVGDVITGEWKVNSDGDYKFRLMSN